MKLVNMILNKLSLVLVSSFLIFAFTATSQSRAGLNIQIGMSKGDIVRILLNNGYSQIQVHDKGFKTGKAYACKDGSKYNVKVDIKGRIKGVAKIGSCRNLITEKQVRRNLQANGFSRIVIDEQNNNYVIVGCKGPQRTRLVISLQGELLKRKKIGNCQEVLDPSDVRQVLRDKGYNRIQFTDRQLPKYMAEACLKNRKLELQINRFGQIKQERRIGRCNPPMDAKNLVNIMRKKGYDRVSVINAKPPRYQVEACAKNVRFDITLDRYGKITKRDRSGTCNPVVDKSQITQLLREEGFTRINIQQRQNGIYRITSCFEGYEKRIKLNRYGELLEEVDGQECSSRSVSQIKEEMNGRGFKRTKFYAEACRQGNKLKITLNHYGDFIGSKRIGNC